MVGVRISELGITVIKFNGRNIVRLETCSDFKMLLSLVRLTSTRIVQVQRSLELGAVCVCVDLLSDLLTADSYYT